MRIRFFSGGALVISTGNGVQRFVDGVSTNSYSLNISDAASVVLGPDGNLWMTKPFSDTVYKVVF
jgi:hypothetical protein